eukprot:TRINITY_DN8338_c0_g1_i2.p1 TRINITY_DN8338_c0_g1~~TRINITY_DN8338_c0_g1_i2.p1  ORF type:complete len:297 (+),score=45.72 TRINITY_DN8338_c0_g1_i2:133-1023(+)
MAPKARVQSPAPVARSNAASRSPSKASPKASPSKASPKKATKQKATQSRPPAILDYTFSDLLSLAICGYIGGRCMQLKFPGPAFLSLAWWPWAVAAAMVTAFGGGTCYALAMKKPTERTFAFQDPVGVVCVLLGLLLSCATVSGCGRPDLPRLEDYLRLGCGDLWHFADLVNNGILIAWGTSKSWQDTQNVDLQFPRAWQDTKGVKSIVRLLMALAATYAYSFGGGIIRDLSARLFLGVEAAGAVGNLSPAIVFPGLLATALFHSLLVLESSPLVQLGLGLPLIMSLFHAGGLVFA